MSVPWGKIAAGSVVAGFVAFLIWLTINLVSKPKTSEPDPSDPDPSEPDPSEPDPSDPDPSEPERTAEEIDIDANSEERYRELGPPSKQECTGVFNINAFQSCKEKDKAGVGWNWMTDFEQETGIGWRCKNINTDHYIVTCESDRFPDVVLKQKLSGKKISTGLMDIGEPFFDGAKVTFTVMPKDAEGNDVINAPVEIGLATSSGSKSCKNVGIDAFSPKYWTHGKNILSIKGKNTGSNDIYVKSQLKDDRGRWKTLKQARTRGNAWYALSGVAGPAGAGIAAGIVENAREKTVWVPEGGRWCADTHNGTTRCRYWDEDGNGDSFLEYMQTSKNPECKNLESYDDLSAPLLRDQIQRLYFDNMKGTTGQQTSIGGASCKR